MKIAIVIVSISAALALYVFLIGRLEDWLNHKARIAKGYIEDRSPYNKYIGKEHDWKPTFHLKHWGIRVFNLPFTPEKTEVFYLENRYDEKANAFIRQNKEYIRELFASKGYTFVYLPDVKVSKEAAEDMIAYHSPEGCDSKKGYANYQQSRIDGEVSGLKSNFLLEYLVNPNARGHVHSSFAWFGHTESIFYGKKFCYIFDYITFNPKEALANPQAVLAEILPELGESRTFVGGGVFSAKKIENEPADEHFDDDKALDEESRKILDDVRSKLDKVRLRGISEAVIARYLKPTPKLSHMTITSNFHIFLDDYNKMEITMEPLVKAVYIFFLRHPEGVIFKDLPDHKKEMEIIYRAVKEKHNNIDKMLSAGTKLKISPAIEALCNPMKNSINEKCTRIKEAFIIHFHDTIASHYYIVGSRAFQKLVSLPRQLVEWEEDK